VSKFLSTLLARCLELLLAMGLLLKLSAWEVTGLLFFLLLLFCFLFFFLFS
jgi:hypothetical protein